MSKKFSATIPDAMGQVIEKLAEIEGSKPATVASYVLQTAIKEGLESGKYPKEWAELPSEPEAGDVDREKVAAFDRINALLTKIADGQQPTTTEITYAARNTTISVDELQTICDRLLTGNGHEINSH